MTFLIVRPVSRIGKVACWLAIFGCGGDGVTVPRDCKWFQEKSWPWDGSEMAIGVSVLAVSLAFPG